MHPFRFIHAADLHLDTPFTGMTGVPDRLRRYLQDSTFAALGGLVDLAVSEQVDFIVISGDVYDASDSSLRAQLRLKEAWEKLERHGIPLYVIHGNHDPLGTRLRLTLPSNVTTFGPSLESVTAVRRQDGLPVAVVSGISYASSSVTENLSRRFKRSTDSPLYHIALLHANVEGQEGHDVYAPCSLADLRDSGYDYWALGHIHKRQVLSESPLVVYPGNLQGRSLKETGAKGCYLVMVDENGSAELEFHELDQVRWHEVDIPIDGLDTEEDWKLRTEEQLEAIRRDMNGKAAIVRCHFTGSGPLHAMISSGREARDLLTELQRQEETRIGTGTSGLFPQGVVWPAGFKLRTRAAIDREQLLQEDSFLGEWFRMVARAEQEPRLLEELLEAALAPMTGDRLLRSLLKSKTAEARQEWLLQAREMAASLLGEEGPAGGSGR